MTLQDWITMFSFFVLVVLLDAGLFWGGRGGELWKQLQWDEIFFPSSCCP